MMIVEASCLVWNHIYLTVEEDIAIEIKLIVMKECQDHGIQTIKSLSRF